MRPHLTKRSIRASSLSTVPPSKDSPEYSSSLANIAARILYQSPLPSGEYLPVYILNAAALPDTKDVDFNKLLPYVLARLPDEEHLIDGKGYEIVFFAGGDEHSASDTKKGRPSWGWIVQAYQVLSRATRKRLQKLYLVHERRWIRVVWDMFSNLISPKFRRKVVHASSLSALALHIPIEHLLIPPSAYYQDRRYSPDIHVPFASGRRAFGALNPLPTSVTGGPRLPRVLREATNFLLAGPNVRTEGLFRVNARAITLDVLREAYDRGQKFIIWKEGGFLMTFPHWKEGFGEVVVDDMEFDDKYASCDNIDDTIDGYGVFTAAGLIKHWYSALREPIFPKSSYAFLERTFGDKDTEILETDVLDLIRESAAWSPVPRVSRMILVNHLLPLLTRIEKEEANKMNAGNLAVCFAPSLLCGPDPIEDARMSSIVARILEYAIHRWNSSVSEACDMNEFKFEELLKIPDDVQDREDPLDSSLATTPNRGEQTEGILLLDDDSSSDSNEEDRPPLPPRNPAVSPSPRSSTDSQNVRRKPAPPVQNPPRYSTITTPIRTDANALSMHELNLEADDRMSDMVKRPSGSPASASSIHRKPLPKTNDPSSE